MKDKSSSSTPPCATASKPCRPVFRFSRRSASPRQPATCKWMYRSGFPSPAGETTSRSKPSPADQGPGHLRPSRAAGEGHPHLAKARSSPPNDPDPHLHRHLDYPPGEEIAPHTGRDPGSRHPKRKLARSKCDDVQFSARGRWPTEPESCVAWWKPPSRAAPVHHIPDTVGYTTPEIFGEIIDNLMNNVAQRGQGIIAVHCHNIWGMATANPSPRSSTGRARLNARSTASATRAATRPWKRS